MADINHTVKAECKVHKKCLFFRQAKKLPYNCEQRIADWMWAGYMHFLETNDRDATTHHKNMFDVALRFD